MSAAKKKPATKKASNQTMQPTQKPRQILSPIDRVITMLKLREPAERMVDLFAQYPPCELDCWARDDDGRTLLHRVMSFRPSLLIVELIISRMVSSSSQTKEQRSIIPEDATDRYGMTPLHIAAASGASIDVVERLLRGTVGPALATDTMNRLPLHWACCNPLGRTPQMPRSASPLFFARCGPARRDCENMLAIIEKLVNVHPQAVWMVDGHGATPFDLAADRRADTSILVSLDIAMRKSQTKKSTTDLSNTEIDSSLDIPWEVSESNDPEVDDVSTMGSGGVSNFGRRRRVKKLAGGLTEAERSRIHIYL